MFKIYNNSNLPNGPTSKALLKFYSENIPLEYYSQEKKESFIAERSNLDKFLSVGLENREISEFKNAPKSIITIIDESKNEIHGILEYTYFFDKQVNNNVFFINWILVNKASRGKGIATVLFSKYLDSTSILNRLGEFSAHKLWVNQNNPAKNIYEKWGYEYHNDGTDEGMISMLRKI